MTLIGIANVLISEGKMNKKISILSLILTTLLILLFNIEPSYALTDLASIISGIGSSQQTLNLSVDTYTVSSDLAIPSNITLHLDRGAIIQIYSGATLFINGPIDDCLYQIFDDKNTDLAKGVKFASGNVMNVRPEWWGARADFKDSSSSLNSNSIEKAVNSHSNFKATVIFATGTYILERAIVLKGTTSLKGANPGDFRNGTVFRSKWPLQFNAIEDSDQISQTEGGSITNLAVVYVSGSAIHFSRQTANWLIRDCLFYNNGGSSIIFDKGSGIIIENNFLQGDYGVVSLYSTDNAHVLYNEMASSALLVDGCSNCELRGNIIFGDPTQGTGRSSLIIANSQNVTVSASRFGPFDYGVKIESSQNISVEKNNFEHILVHGIYLFGDNKNIMIKNNIIGTSWKAGQGDGIYTEGTLEGGSITGNVIGGWDLGNINYLASTSTGNYPGIENNTGVDLGNSFPVLEQSSSPSVAISSKWKTNNSSSMSISDFSKAPLGKEIFILFGDTNTTIQFSGSSSLGGHNNTDWHPQIGDFIHCQKANDYYWDCSCSDGIHDSSVLYGDVSGDGNLSAYDASLAAQYAVGSITLTAEQITRADVTGDGNVSAYDASLIAQKAVGLIDKFPVEG